jgi:hypothetical protein
MPFDIPRWVPPAAANIIKWRSTLPGVAARDIALLERLARRDELTSLDAGEIVFMILHAEAQSPANLAVDSAEKSPDVPRVNRGSVINRGPSSNLARICDGHPSTD